MSEAEQYVDGATVQWGALATAIVGSWVLAWGYGVIDVLRLAGNGAAYGARSLFGFAAGLVSQATGYMPDAVDGAVAQTELFLGMLGPAAFPASFVLSLAGVYVAYRWWAP